MVMSGAGEAAVLSTNNYSHSAALFILTKKRDTHGGQHLLQGTVGI